MASGVVDVPLQERLKGGVARCLVCERRCVLREGARGFCRVRFNEGGRIRAETYGILSAVESRPIEIKPFFHFWPGSTALTFSTWSCNFRCPWCQNYHLSAVPPPSGAKPVPPQDIVGRALRAGDEGLCASFNEPTLLFEYTLDLFRMGRGCGLYSTYVSNGYMTPDALRLLAESGLDAIKIDVKGDDEVYRKILSARSDVVWRNVEHALRLGLHVEVVFLAVTGVSDRWEVIEDVVENHLKHAGEEVPLHINRYYPAYRYLEPPTRIDTLLEAREHAMREGIRYVYVGNVPSEEYSHTYCPGCGRVLIKRWGYGVVSYRLTPDNRCPRCGEEIPIRGRFVEKGGRPLLL